MLGKHTFVVARIGTAASQPAATEGTRAADASLRRIGAALARASAREHWHVATTNGAHDARAHATTPTPATTEPRQ
jgi:hypothetical protein